MLQNVLNVLVRLGGAALAQAPQAQAPQQTLPNPAGSTGAMSFVADTSKQSNFQPYIFWAYGGACVLLFLFTLWTFLESKALTNRLTYLKSRFREAHPKEAEEGME